MATLPQSFKNHFLMATPALETGFFAGSLTYICEHNEAGAMGVVVNQPLAIDLANILEHLDLPSPTQSAGQPIMAGGPVQVDHGFVLHSGGGDWDSTLEVSSDISLTTSKDILAAIARGAGPPDHLITLGYAGWAPGQLEQELLQNSWLTVPASSDILFKVPCDERLQAAGFSLGIDIRLLSAATGHA